MFPLKIVIFHCYVSLPEGKHTNHPQMVGLLDCPHEIHGFGHESKPFVSWMNIKIAGTAGMYFIRPSPNDVFLDRGEITAAHLISFAYRLIVVNPFDDQSTKFDQWFGRTLWGNLQVIVHP